MDLHYNAFISYRHHPQDIKVAETIHRSLERFRVPKALRKEGKTIERIFRDKEELPITSSLTDTISMALRNSDYQIVICSTHLKDSYWVQREIETFLQTHSKDKVLTVLVDGDNPYDVIPEILTYEDVVDPATGETFREPIEPLSCDWRLPKREAMKKELPRLAAVLLGCSYDDLIQRQKQYRQRRLLTGISIGMAGSLALAGYFLHTSIQIQESLNQSLRNQSQYLASASQEKLNNGDRLSALALAMEALPSEENQRPYVAAAEQALSNALRLYEAEGELISVASFNADSTINDFVVTDDGTVIYILDNQHTVTAWDTVDIKKLSTFNIINTPLMDSILLADAKGNLLTLGGTEGKTLMSYRSDGTLQWSVDGIQDMAFRNEKSTLLAIRRVSSDSSDPTADEFQLLQLDPDTGELVTEPYTAFQYATMYSPEFTTDHYFEGQPISVRGYASNGIDVILATSPEKQSSRILLNYDAFFHGSSVTKDGLLYALVTENEDINNVRWANYYSYTQATAYLHCFDMNTGKQKWRTPITYYNYSEANMVAPIPNTDRIFCQHGSAFLQIDAKTGKILEECHSTSIPLSIQMRDTTAWVLFNNGCAGSYTFATNTIGYIQYMENGLLMGHNNQGIYVVPQLSSSILLYRTTADDSYEAFGGEYDDYINQLRISDTHMAIYGMGTLNLFDLSAKQLMWTQDIGYSQYLLGFSADGTKLYTRKYNDIRQTDLQSGEGVEWSMPLITELSHSLYSEAIGYADDTICCVIYSYIDNLPHILFIDCRTQEFISHVFTTDEDPETWRAYGNTPKVLHMTDTYALIRTAAGRLYRIDRATGEISVIAEKVTANAVLYEDREKERLAISTEEGILVTDSLGQQVATIPLEDSFAVSLFFYKDLLLCLSSDGAVYRYDQNGSQIGKTATSLYSNYFAQANNISSQIPPVTWGVTPDDEVVVNIFSMGNIINTENWERTCDVPSLVFYDQLQDSFVCQSSDMIYSYKRCTLEDIVAKAKTELKGFELSEAQRAYYGLD